MTSGSANDSSLTAGRATGAGLLESDRAGVSASRRPEAGIGVNKFGPLFALTLFR